MMGPSVNDSFAYILLNGPIRESHWHIYTARWAHPSMTVLYIYCMIGPSLDDTVIYIWKMGPFVNHTMIYSQVQIIIIFTEMKVINNTTSHSYQRIHCKVQSYFFPFRVLRIFLPLPFEVLLCFSEAAFLPFFGLQCNINDSQSLQ